MYEHAFALYFGDIRQPGEVTSGHSCLFSCFISSVATDLSNMTESVWLKDILPHHKIGDTPRGVSLDSSWKLWWKLYHYWYEQTERFSDYFMLLFTEVLVIVNLMMSS